MLHACACLCALCALALARVPVCVPYMRAELLPDVGIAVESRESTTDRSAFGVPFANLLILKAFALA